ncbi:MAG: gephyrin-like molybdotransferase Glp [Pseudomonadota bacterium]
MHDSERLRHDEALAILRRAARTLVGAESVPLFEAAGRIIAAPITASSPVPAHTNAAVDGYAFSHADLAAEGSSVLQIAGRAAAGRPFQAALAGGPSGSHAAHHQQRAPAVRIFTGAALPTTCDTVVMQEDVTVRADPSNANVRLVEVPAGLRHGANVRQAGEDVAAGAVLFETGATLRPQDLAGLASIGVAEPTCFKRLNVAVVSTGDEVVRPGAPLAFGQVYDANAPMLQALIASTGAHAVDAGVLPDDPVALKDRLLALAQTYDGVITSGGASRGEEDHLITVLDEIGERHLWQLAVKPGRPMTFGRIGRVPMIGLPGNPVAVFVCFLLYVAPLLRALQGAPWHEPRREWLTADFAMTGRKTGRREFWRGHVEGTGEATRVRKFERDGSGLISGLRAADGLIEIPEEHGDVAPGDQVAFIPFSAFGLAYR